MASSNPRNQLPALEHQRGLWQAFFPIYGRPTMRHLTRQATVQLATMIPRDVRITGAWRFTELTGVDGRRWLLAEAPAIGPIDPTATRQVAAFITRSLPRQAAAITHPASAPKTAA